MTQVRPSRRTVLALGAGTALAATLPACGTATAEVPHGKGLSGQLKRLEREHAARLGVFARDLATGRTVRYRADERFPMCSVFKGLAAAAVLRDLDHDGEFLAKRIHYTKKYVTDAGYAPISSEPRNVAHGMTVTELCAAAVSHSDNGAANLLLRELGGPTAITRFCRSLGDDETRLDRWEPQLNSAEPWRTTDTTTPRAIGTTYGRLVVGRALAAEDRKRLKDWLIANTTNTKRFRAGLPDGWITADKTGGGSEYGVANDVGVAWPPGRSPVLLSVLTTTHAPEGPSDDALVAKAAELVAAALV